MPVQKQLLLGEADAASRQVKEYEGATSRQVKEFREEEVMEDLSYHTQEFLEPQGPEMWRRVLCEIFTQYDDGRYFQDVRGAFEQSLSLSILWNEFCTELASQKVSF